MAAAELDGFLIMMFKLLTTLTPHSDECRSVRFSFDDLWLLTRSLDGMKYHARITVVAARLTAVLL